MNGSVTQLRVGLGYVPLREQYVVRAYHYHKGCACTYRELAAEQQGEGRLPQARLYLDIAHIELGKANRILREGLA